jgi:hypothetical protein
MLLMNSKLFIITQEKLVFINLIINLKLKMKGYKNISIK